jgi:hypothetical protein
VEVIDLQAFEAFIKERGLVPEKTLPYYLPWVRKFLQAVLPSAAQVSQGTGNLFLVFGSLSSDSFAW